jgi:cell division protein FtsI (penicillin-binding protein 3)
MALAFVGIGARLVELQALGLGHYARLGLDQRVATLPLAAERGSIFDRNGTDLAVSVPQQTVVADPRVVHDPDGDAAKLAPVLGVDRATLRARLAQHDRAFVYLARKVDDATVARVKALGLGEVSFVPESKRFYPAGGLAGPLVGFVGTDNNGLGGLESAYERALTGRPGRVVLERDPRGREIPSGQRSLRLAERGRDLVLTVDQALQYEVEQTLADEVAAQSAKGGTAIVVDVKTGDVLAMASVDGGNGTTLAHPAAPTERNRPLTDVYEPGSTNKVITVASALEAGLVSPTTVFSVPDTIQVGDHSFQDHDPHPVANWTVADILRQSSNVGAILIGQQVGKDRLDASLRAFGLGQKTAIRFPGEAAGLLLPPSQYSVTSMGTVPIGNGLAVTAMQMLDVFATLANGGLSRPPRLVDATVDAQGMRHSVPRERPVRVVSDGTAAAMSDMLTQVVTGGTGTEAAIQGYTVAGKTGTARKPPYDTPPYRYVASFAGFAPVESPRLAAIVVLDEPGGEIFGGQVAAPVFSRIMQYALRLERIPPVLPLPAAGALPVGGAPGGGAASPTGGVARTPGRLKPSASPSG